ncbi:hypothetical protein [Mycoplasma struthionis]|uniref:Uncharacterized protein n=1 Tax=Mycoplasma struthionis TaxID=538220 RepID=A0A3G8LG52_9MOLU|nr:hypothetical protein [Mycoplasma struthionis]AZG68434.1 hypothetical protein EGN60_00365 [Mycoplasma struthionis]
MIFLGIENINTLHENINNELLNNIKEVAKLNETLVNKFLEKFSSFSKKDIKSSTLYKNLITENEQNEVFAILDFIKATNQELSSVLSFKTKNAINSIEDFSSVVQTLKNNLKNNLQLLDNLILVSDKHFTEAKADFESKISNILPNTPLLANTANFSVIADFAVANAQASAAAARDKLQKKVDEVVRYTTLGDDAIWYKYAEETKKNELRAALTNAQQILQNNNSNSEQDYNQKYNSLNTAFGNVSHNKIEEYQKNKIMNDMTNWPATPEQIKELKRTVEVKDIQDKASIIKEMVEGYATVKSQITTIADLTRLSQTRKKEAVDIIVNYPINPGRRNGAFTLATRRDSFLKNLDKAIEIPEQTRHALEEEINGVKDQVTSSGQMNGLNNRFNIIKRIYQKLNNTPEITSDLKRIYENYIQINNRTALKQLDEGYIPNSIVNLKRIKDADTTLEIKKILSTELISFSSETQWPSIMDEKLPAAELKTVLERKADEIENYKQGKDDLLSYANQDILNNLNSNIASIKSKKLSTNLDSLSNYKTLESTINTQYEAIKEPAIVAYQKEKFNKLIDSWNPPFSQNHISKLKEIINKVSTIEQFKQEYANINALKPKAETIKNLDPILENNEKDDLIDKIISLKDNSSEQDNIVSLGNKEVDLLQKLNAKQDYPFLTKDGYKNDVEGLNSLSEVSSLVDKLEKHNKFKELEQKLKEAKEYLAKNLNDLDLIDPKGKATLKEKINLADGVVKQGIDAGTKEIYQQRIDELNVALNSVSNNNLLDALRNKLIQDLNNMQPALTDANRIKLENVIKNPLLKTS